MRAVQATGIVFLHLVAFAVAANTPNNTARVEMALDVAPVWAGHRVGFCLLTDPPQQYVAFYDENRRMTVAARTLDSPEWTFQKLPSTLGWDSHNYVTMAVDEDGYIHLSGNMHCDPLLYFRTSKPRDIHSFEKVPNMVGRQEVRCTYPKFISGPRGELIFTYRDGGSGNGNQIYDVYDTETGAWRRLLDRPLTDGRGKMNAYIVGPVRGPDGRFHICWVWRDTPDCSTNHHLCYARSPDMVHWEAADGTPISLPMTINTDAVVVDPVPPKGGMINGNTRIGFDTDRRPVVSYHKFDENGATQLYNARFEDGAWRIYRTSNWDYRWYFQGGGSIHFEIRVSPVVPDEDGLLTQQYRHDIYGGGIWSLDPDTLRPLGELPKRSSWPARLSRPESDFPGMQVNWRNDLGKDPDTASEYALRWETLGVNRDRPREETPPPSTLRLFKLKHN